MPENRPPITWSPEARADLEEIWTYYAEVAGTQTADNVVRNIDSSCRLLADYPLGGRARDELRRGMRSLTARSHVIFYRLVIDARGDRAGAGRPARYRGDLRRQ